jgi:hypothetical protein
MDCKGSDLRDLTQHLLRKTATQTGRRTDDRAEILTRDPQECEGQVPTARLSRWIINLLKTNLICFIYGLSAYRAVNTLHFGYKDQSLNVL